MSKLHLRIPRVVVIRSDDAMFACIPLRWSWNVSNDNVGAGQTPKLQERIQGLSEETQSYHSIRSLSSSKTFIFLNMKLSGEIRI